MRVRLEPNLVVRDADHPILVRQFDTRAERSAYLMGVADASQEGCPIVTALEEPSTATEEGTE